MNMMISYQELVRTFPKVWLRLATLVFICWIDCCLDVAIWTASDSEMINETMMTVIVVV